jgi:hypothetical protein
LEGALLKQGLAAALAMGDERARARALAALAPQLDTVAAGQKIQIALLDILDGLQHKLQAELLGILATNNLITPQTLNLSSKSIEDIANSIIEVCTKWRWV